MNSVDANGKHLESSGHTLVKIIEECQDSKEIKDRLLKLPFADKILNGHANFEYLTLAGLETAIHSAVYLNENTEALIDEFLWRIGKDEKEFKKYFEYVDLYITTHNDTSGITTESDDHSINLRDKLRNNTQELRQIINTYFPNDQKVIVVKLAPKAAVKNTLIYNELLLRYRGIHLSENVNARFGNVVSPSRCAFYGKLRLLKWCTQLHGFAWHKDICSFAASNGHLQCLKYAHTHGCGWDWRTCARAAKAGSLECLQYAHSHGCELGTHMYSLDAISDDCADYIRQHTL